MNENEIIKDIIIIAAKIGLKQGDKYSRSDYYSNGAKFSHYDIYDNGKTWSYYCKKAGFEDRTKLPVSDDEYFQRLLKAVDTLGRFPKTSERKEYDLNFRKSRWPTLNDFILEAINKGYVEDIDNRIKGNQTENELGKKVYKVVDCTFNTNKKAPPIPDATKRRNWERINLSCFPYAPQDEQGVVAIFSILCFKGVLPWQIVDLNGGKGIDAVCYDDKSQSFLKVEFKYCLSKHSFNHAIDSFDILVCWTNKWKDIGKEVIELKELLKK